MADRSRGGLVGAIGWTATSGIVLISSGVIALIVSEFAAALSVPEVFLSLVGAFAAIQGLRYVSGARRADRVRTSFGDPERRVTVPTPGAEIDEKTARALRGDRSAASHRRQLRTRFRELAVAALVARTDRDEAAARDAVESGRWPTDTAAAAFLSHGRFSIAIRARAFLRRQSVYAIGIERSIDAIEALWDSTTVQTKRDTSSNRRRPQTRLSPEDSHE
ncbi:DUF7269 family protein [Halalkalirubrum salinum]|uniref:DUF7269 family protein n=1 Tax=Halalkalirubrum salinum TaxID=2563889 RepID=UPI0010FB1EB1|nr:hypothetical protein [Halalkalirubrum salinum]